MNPKVSLIHSYLCPQSPGSLQRLPFSSLEHGAGESLDIQQGKEGKEAVSKRDLKRKKSKKDAVGTERLETGRVAYSFLHVVPTEICKNFKSQLSVSVKLLLQ